MSLTWLLNIKTRIKTDVKYSNFKSDISRGGWVLGGCHKSDGKFCETVPNEKQEYEIRIMKTHFLSYDFFSKLHEF